MCEPLRIGVVGGGRLGRAVAGACARQGYPIVLTASAGTGWHAEAVPQVIVDASAPAAQQAVREYCLRYRVALVECVSNLSQDQWAALGGLAGQVPVVRATNLAVGHYLQSRLIEYLAALRTPAALAPVAYVAERHPATKAHRPSATAVELARAWASAGGAEVGSISSRREGLPVSDHEIVWAWPAETVTLRHSVSSLDAAARGALAAARWVAGRRPGLASMRAVFDDLFLAAPLASAALAPVPLSNAPRDVEVAP